MTQAGPKGRTGLFGGTFNPIHLGHLHLAQEALLAFELDRVLFIPNRLPPHRRHGALVDTAHRCTMVELAIASNPSFFLSRVELDREEDGPSYSVDTVEALHAAAPEAPLYFLCGADALMRYAWKDLDRMLGRLAAMVCVTRPGFSLAELDRRLDGLGLVNRARLQNLEVTGYHLSSSEIRRRLARGCSVRYMVSREVEEYIVKFELYKALEVSVERD